MARMRKLYKKYERHILLGLVMILLATFSITGALKCQGDPGSNTLALGGTYDVSPSERAEVSDEDFDRQYARNQYFQRAMRMSTREFRNFQLGLTAPGSFKDAWAHLILLSAGKEAGYRAGDIQVRNATEDMVGLSLYLRARMPFTEVNYQQFLKDNYVGTPEQFEQGVRDVVVKDQFLYPLVTVSRYQVPYAAAYDAWKGARERVDLEYVALPDAPFEGAVRATETSRAQISRQQTRLERVGATAKQVRRVLARLEVVRQRSASAGPDGQMGTDDDEPGAYPESLAALDTPPEPYKVAPDPWGQDLRYTVGGALPDVRSAGPDETFDTADDITGETQRQFDTHAALHKLAEAINQHRKGTEAWPENLDALLAPSGEGRLPVLTSPVRDGWGHAFAYAAGEAPTLSALGPDGAPGGGDDLTLTLDPEAVRVEPGAALAPYLLEDAADAWGRPLRIALARSEPATWHVTSAGEDGVAGNDDDLLTGNERELLTFFRGVQGDFRLPERRRFETLFIHLPLVSDATLKRLWERYPTLRPTDEEELYEYWLAYRGEEYFYGAEEPGDAEKGHGADLARRVAPEVTPTLVPDRSIFPDPLKAAEEPKDDGEEPKDDGEEPKDDGEEPKDDGEEPKDDGTPDVDVDTEARKTYREKGWREIVIRERFLEAVLNDLLQRCRESHLAVTKARAAHAAWEAAGKADAQALGAWETANAGVPEAERAPKPVATAGTEPEIPEEVTFESLYAGELAETRGDEDPPAIQYWQTPTLMTAEEWEALPHFDEELGYTLDRLKVDGEYPGIPAQLQRRLTKVLVRRLEVKPAEDQPYKDVREAVMDRFVARRRMDRAAEELQTLKDEILAAEGAAPGDEDPTPDPEAFQKALTAWGERHGAPYHLETTGLFLGSVPPPALAAPDGASDEEAARIARRNFVWRTGYATVRPSEAGQDNVEAKPGTFGRNVSRDAVLDEPPQTPEGEEAAPLDRGTGHAYLIRVKERVYPTEREFSPRRYVEHLTDEVFGGREQLRMQRPLKELKGRYFQALAHWLDDIDWLQLKFKLQTNSELNVLEERRQK